MKSKMEILQTFIYSFLGIWALLLIAGIILSGCSVVRSDISAKDYKEGMVYYYLPETLIKINSTVKVAVYYDGKDSTLLSSCKVIEQKFVLETENIADTRELISLIYKPNALMADYLKYQVNNKGLLESVTVKTEDKTATIVNMVANAPAQILSIKPSETRDDKAILRINEFSSEFFVKASKIKGKSKDIEWNILITNELGKEDFTSVIASFSVKINLNESEEKNIKSISGQKNNYVEGLLTRPLLNADFQISTTMITGQLQVWESSLRIVDHGKLINIPIKRTAFARRENNIVIEDGVIKSNEITNPSSVEGFVSIPIDLAKAIVSIPGQLVTFKYDNTVRLKDLVEQKGILEAKLLENEKFQLSRENEINKLLNEIKIAELTRANDTKKLTFELQQKMLEAEKNQLQMLKELEELKNEIEELKTKEND
ncbi:MAG: hypothetical protein WAT92_12750 [Saprospiraceae bacterium]